MRMSSSAHVLNLIPLSSHGGVSLHTTQGINTLMIQSLVTGALSRFGTVLTPEQSERLRSFQADEAVTVATTEVERKWCPSEPGQLEAVARIELAATKVSRIQQGYLCVGESEARLRQKGSEYFLTLKSCGGLVRKEVEIPLAEKQFNDLWPGTEGRRIEKMRSVIPFEQSLGERVVIEVDRFRGGCEPLVLVEIEFPSIQKAVEFKPPEFFGADVTENSDYKNKSLACAGMPNISLSALRAPHRGA